MGSEMCIRDSLYPIAVCLITVVVGGLFIRETKDHKIDTEV